VVVSYAFGDSSDAARRLAVVHRVFVPLADRLLRDVVHSSPGVVADLGGGPGHTTRFLVERWPAAEVIGVEASATFLALAKSHVPGVRFVHGDVTDPDALPAGRADLVYARCLLAHLPDVAGAISTWRAWLAPEGRLVLEEPERIETDDPVFRTYLAATGDAVAARGATMLAGPLVDRATAGLERAGTRAGSTVAASALWSLSSSSRPAVLVRRRWRTARRTPTPSLRTCVFADDQREDQPLGIAHHLYTPV
jgi:trans-aconitate 2-methyltransferase